MSTPSGPPRRLARPACAHGSTLGRRRQRALPALLGALALVLVIACGDVAPTAAVVGVTIGEGDQALAVADERQLTATVTTTGTADTGVTWTSGDDGIASVTTTGLVTAHAPGATTITATSTADPNKTAGVTITVTPANAVVGVTIGEGDQALAVADERQLTATVTTTGTADTGVTWTSGDDGIASVTTTGLVTAHAPGATTITATSTADVTKFDRVSVLVAAEIIDGFACSSLDDFVLSDISSQVLVVYQQAEGDAATRASTARSALEVTRRHEGRLVRTGIGSQPDLFDFPPARGDVALAALRARPDVAHAVRNVPLARRGTPNDALYGSQQWNMSAFGAETAWAVTDGATPPLAAVVIAIIDDGVAIDHPDLRDAVLAGWDAVHQDDDPRNCIDHGTHVAGIAGATRDNAIGVAGVGSTDWIRLLPVKVWADGTDAGASTGLNFVVDGMRWAAGLPITGAPPNPTPADVLNLSLGTTSTDPNLQAFFAAVIDEIEATGATVVAAAGNSGVDTFGVDYPAAVSTVAVGSVDASFQRSAFSTFGEGLSLMAPGGLGGAGCGAIAATGLAVDAGIARHAYVCKAGTSMATPYVAGAVALLIGSEPALRGRPNDIADRLAVAAARRPGGEEAQYGAGILCLDALLDPAGAPVCGDVP